MKIKILIFFIMSGLFAKDVPTPGMTLENGTPTFQANKNTIFGKVKCLILLLNKNEWLQKVAAIVSDDIAFTDQIEPEIKKVNKFDKKILKKLFDEGTTLCCVISDEIVSGHKASVGLKISFFYTDNETPIFEYLIKENEFITAGHKAADKIIQEATGDSLALAKLTYCKEISPRHKVICTSDYTCKKEKVVVSAKTANVVPAWHPWLPYIFFTQLTRTNNRLMSVDLSKNKQHVICSFSGLNMQPSFSKDGKKVALCLSAKDGNSEIFLYDQEKSRKASKRVFTQLTHNGGNNVAPTLLANGDIVFCSDFETGYPQIYHLKAGERHAHRLTSGSGYCVSPCYCEANNSVMFSKSVNGTFQLFTLPVCHERSEKQLTFNEGDKKDPSWSQSGKYAAFSYQYVNSAGHRTSQIAAINCPSGKIRVLSTGKQNRYSPSWRSVA